MDKYIILPDGKRYTHYDTYGTYQEARLMGQYHKKKDKNKYYILTYETRGFATQKRYRLYLTKIIKPF